VLQDSVKCSNWPHERIGAAGDAIPPTPVLLVPDGIQSRGGVTGASGSGGPRGIIRKFASPSASGRYRNIREA